MSFFASSKHRSRKFLFFTGLLGVSVLTLAQVTLKFRMLSGYSLSSDAPVTKGKPTLFVFETPERFEEVFKPVDGSGKRVDKPNFSREMAIGIALPPTNKPPKLSISRVFVQDSVLTVRYIKMADTSLIKNPLPVTSQPTLLLAIPAQTVLSTRIIENGRVVATLRKKDTD
jgi:hypothetical protein